ncbi:alpha/beta fold hydrolase [Cellulomonas sp. P22]|uniref:alpha/beta fold hydrolase n=1 Tax=Cellulomonas sp. P22 TaxID=3373189 RepID=UPI0037BAF2EC
MGAFVLVPGAGGDAWYWHRVVPLLRAAGHDALAVDLPGDDPAATLPEYARLVRDAIGDRTGVVLVAQSLGGFTAPLVAAHGAVRAVVLVNAMVPVPGETPGEWWEATGWADAQARAAADGGYPHGLDPEVVFLHDVPPEVLATGGEPRGEADAVFGSVCDFTAWGAPVHVLAGADDRFFPLGFQRAVARDRLGLPVEVLPGGHLVALARPDELVGRLLQV